MVAFSLLLLPTALAIHQPTARDVSRAATMVPRPQFLGTDFADMGRVLNSHLINTPDLTTKPCDQFNIQDLHVTLKDLFQYAAPELLQVYAETGENRHRHEESVADLDAQHQTMLKLTASPELHDVHRDGLCHKTVMWFVHHLSESDREEVKQLITLPLLPLKKHIAPVAAKADTQTVYKVYNEHSTCLACHTAGIPNQGVLSPPITPDPKHPGWDRARRCDEPCTQCDVQYDPPCGPCEGVGGPYFGDPVADFKPTPCTVVSLPDKVPVSERMPRNLPPQFTVQLQGTDRLVRKQNPDPKKKGAYSNIHGTMYYDYGKDPLTSDVIRLRHDTYYDSEPYKTLDHGHVTEIHQQSRAQMKANITGAMFSTIAAMSKLPAQGGCTCVPDPVGVPHWDSFSDATYMGRISLEMEYINRTTVVDHYSKWFFHLFIDADPKSDTYKLPLRFYSPYAGFAVYHSWVLGDPAVGRFDVWNASLPKTVDKCMNPQKKAVCNSFNPTVPTEAEEQAAARMPTQHGMMGAGWPFIDNFGI